MAVTALKNLRFSDFLQLNLEVSEAAMIDKIEVGRCPHGCLAEEATPLPIANILAHPGLAIDGLMHMPRG